MNVGSLFSGIGGIELGFEREGFPTSWFVENNPYCQAALRKNFPGKPVYGNITKIDFKKLAPVEILTGGFPCQPHSIAGKRKASKDERDLWSEFYRAVCEIRPKYVVAENVPGLITSEHGKFFPKILRDLAEAGYDAEWFTLQAAHFGALHRRERIFIIAHSNGNGCGYTGKRGSQRGIQSAQSESTQCSVGTPHFPANINGERCGRWCEVQSEEEYAREVAGRIDNAQEISITDPNREHGKTREKVYGGKPNAERRIITDDWSKRVQRFREETLQGGGGLSWCQNVRRIEDLRERPDIPEPLIRGKNNGVSCRVERTRALGNAVVPQVAQFIARLIKETEEGYYEKTRIVI